jgi:hypothetical protein
MYTHEEDVLDVPLGVYSEVFHTLIAHHVSIFV